MRNISNEVCMSSLGVNRATFCPLDMVVMGKALLNMTVVSEIGRALGRPWLNIGIDMYSRCIWGMGLSLERGIVEMLVNGMSNKKNIKEEHKTINQWDVYGKPKIILTDSKLDVASQRMVADVMGSILQYRLGNTLRFFGAIEKFLITMNNNLFHNVNTGNFTLHELTGLITRYIVDDYHIAPNIDLPIECNIPAKRYAEGIELYGRPRL